MKGIEQFNEGLQKVMRKMFSYVDADINETDFHETGWYSKYSWTEEEQEECIDWMINELNTSKVFREDILKKPTWKNKRNYEKAAHEFTFQYGWAVTQKGGDNK
jgi:hypothetical protein